MTFINIVVNSCEDLNYRMYLQHEFTMMYIDDYLEELEMRGRDYPALQEQIKAYQDNYFDLGILVSWEQLRYHKKLRSIVQYCMCIHAVV